jgi:hypothetical protein
VNASLVNSLVNTYAIMKVSSFSRVCSYLGCVFGMSALGTNMEIGDRHYRRCIILLYGMERSMKSVPVVLWLVVDC